MTSGRRKTQRVKTARKNSKRIMKSYRRRRSVRKYKTVKHGGMGFVGNIQRSLGSKSGSIFKDTDNMGTLISKTTEYNKLKNTTPQPPGFQAMRESLAQLILYYANTNPNGSSVSEDERAAAERKTYVYNIDTSFTMDTLKGHPNSTNATDLDYEIIAAAASAASGASAAAAASAASAASAAADDDDDDDDDDAEFAAELELYEDELRNANG